MIKKNIFYILTVFVLYILQYVLVPFSFKGIFPDLLFVFFVALIVFENEKYASIYGLIIGLLSDYTSGSIFGLRSIMYMLLGYIIAVLVDELMKKGFVTFLLVFLVLFIFSRSIFILQYLLLEGKSPLGIILLNITLPDLLLTAPFALILGFPLYLLRRKALASGTNN